MIKNFIITALRSLMRQKSYFLINVLGLAIGLTSFIFITMFVLHELSYDRFHSKSDNIYRVQVSGLMSGMDFEQAISAAPMAKALINDYPEVENVVRIADFNAWLVSYKDKKFNEDGVLFADSTFFEIFDFKLLRGNPETALSEPRSMILTEKSAKRYFGDEDPMGKRLTVEEDTIFYTVTGIIENCPTNSHISFDMIGSMNSIRQSFQNFWLNHGYYTYMVLKESTDIKEFESKIQEMVRVYVGPEIKRFLGITVDDFEKAGNYFGYSLQALKDIHLHSKLQEELRPNGNISYVYTFSIIALMILIIAIINFVNLATAKSASRSKEVGVRKVVGSTKRSLVFQFVSESVLLSFIATITAVFLVYILTPYFYNLVGNELEVSLFTSKFGIPLIILLALFVGILSGIYPAFVLAAFKPVKVLKGSLKGGAKSGWMRSVLVVLQFSVSIIIIIGTILVYQQLSFMQNKNLGFDKDQLLVIRRPDALDTKIEVFKQELRKNPSIKGAANSRAIPGKDYSNNAFWVENDVEKNTYLLFQNWVSMEYPQMMGYEIVLGRFFSKEFGTDSAGVIINETAVKKLGFENPIGKNLLRPTNQEGEMGKVPIIGVVKDFHIQSLHHKIEPVAMTVMPGNWEGYLTVRLSGDNLPSTIDYIENTWNNYAAKQPFQYFFFDEEFNNLYKSEQQTGRIFIVFAILAIFIACLGLLGLIAYTATVRTKEIGIRKAIGASVQSIIKMLSFETLKLIIISTIIAWPMAYFGIKYWLQEFAHRSNIDPMSFVIATILTLVIGWLAISFQAIRAALLNPSDALRYE
jgi:putative ABC transport system permease protein